MNSLINKWIENGSHYAEGVRIYNEIGTDSFLKRLFQKPESSFYKKKLTEALTALLTPDQPKVQPAPVPPEQAKAPGNNHEKAPTSEPAAPSASEPPELLKVISDINSTFAEIRGLHPYLSILEEGEGLRLLAKNIVQNGKRNAELWQRRNYINEHGRDYQAPEPVKPVMIDLNLVNTREQIRKSLNKAENRAKKQKPVNAKTLALIEERKKELQAIDAKIALIKQEGGANG